MSASPMTISARRVSSATNHETQGAAVAASAPGGLTATSASAPRGADLFGTTPGGSRLTYSREQLLQLASSPLSASPPKGLGPNGIPAEISRSPEKSYYTYGSSSTSHPGQAGRASGADLGLATGSNGSASGRTSRGLDLSPSRQNQQDVPFSSRYITGASSFGNTPKSAKVGPIKGFAPSSPTNFRARSPSTSFNVNAHGTSPTSHNTAAAAAAGGSPITATIPTTTARFGAPRSPGSAFSFSGPVSPTQTFSTSNISRKASNGSASRPRGFDSSAAAAAAAAAVARDDTRASTMQGEEHFHMDL